MVCASNAAKILTLDASRGYRTPLDAFHARSDENFYLHKTQPIPKRAAIDSALLRLAPAIPPHERTAVVDHAIDSRGLSFARPETAAWLSLVAYVWQSSLCSKIYKFLNTTDLIFY